MNEEQKKLAQEALESPLVRHLLASDGFPVRFYCKTDEEYKDFEEKEAIQTANEFKIFEKNKKSAEAKINNLRNYGLTIEDLKVLELGMIKTAHCGTHNIKIPREAKQKLNPDEIIAIYFGVVLYKNSPSFYSELVREIKDMNAKEAMKEIIKSFNKTAYDPERGNASFNRFVKNLNANNSKMVFPRTPGEEQKRIDSLEENVCREFISSFEKPYVGPEHEENMTKQHPGGRYRDPNYEGKSRTGVELRGANGKRVEEAKEAYAREIIKTASRD